MQPLLKVINLIHDREEGKSVGEELEKSIEVAISEGSSGVWESSGSWLIKLAKEDSAYNHLWFNLASHPSAKVRFRVASFIEGIGNQQASELFSILSTDKSKKVAEHAKGKWALKNGFYKNT